jgi:flagellar protein FliS
MNTLKQSGAKALSQYAMIGIQTGIVSASPHRLIQMLMDGALEKISIARGCMERDEIADKGANISWAISIIEGLRGSLDHKEGGKIAQNLDMLYEYMSHRLLESNLRNDLDILSEIHELLGEVREGWSGIQYVAEGNEVPTTGNQHGSVSHAIG